MKIPSVPGKGAEQVTQRATGAEERAAEAARGTAKTTTEGASEVTSKAAEAAEPVRSGARAAAKAVPQKLAGLTRMLALYKLLRAAPAVTATVAAMGVAVWVVRRARKH